MTIAEIIKQKRMISKISESLIFYRYNVNYIYYYIFYNNSTEEFLKEVNLVLKGKLAYIDNECIGTIDYICKEKTNNMWWCIVKEDYETFARHSLNIVHL